MGQAPCGKSECAVTGITVRGEEWNRVKGHVS